MKELIIEKLRNMTKNDTSILNIISKYDILKKAVGFIINYNKSNNGPYHNLNHLLTVTKHTYLGLKFMGLLNDKNAEGLLLGALFHDFNHSLGKFKDDENITEAKEQLKKFINTVNYKSDLDFINSIIDATQYPYTIDSNELTIYQKLIRDADMCQIFEYDWLKQNILGLSEELNIDIKSFLPNQRKFLENLKFLTPYGKDLKKKYFDDIMHDFTILEEIIAYEI